MQIENKHFENFLESLGFFGEIHRTGRGEGRNPSLKQQAKRMRSWFRYTPSSTDWYPMDYPLFLMYFLYQLRTYFLYLLVLILRCWWTVPPFLISLSGIFLVEFFLRFLLKSFCLNPFILYELCIYSFESFSLFFYLWSSFFCTLLRFLF